MAQGVDGAHVRNVAPVTNGHVVQVVADVLNEAVVANGHIAQRGIIYATVLHEAVGDFHGPPPVAQASPAIELHAMAAAGVEVISY